MRYQRMILLLFLCLACALALTACYTEPDPWPASHAVAPDNTTAGTDISSPAAAPVESGVEPTATPDMHELDTGTDPGLNG